jgi:acyl-CoA dehydrogenase|tara:strand:+ start:2239 stop:3429 length:1191 start_codon:yes stop_codon:yes gene_type:complete
METTEKFRLDTRDWLIANCPESQRQPIVKDQQIWGGRRRSFYSDDAKLWFERMRDRGWTAPSWPIQYGGGGMSPEQAKILDQEMKTLGCRPALYDIGLWMFGPALLEYGTDEQKQEHIPKIVRGEIRWAQGYSEPSAGSDLASLKTRADDKGDHFLVNGTKMWTTQGDKSDWIFCLVRTDNDAPKQQGISFLLIDMATEGVLARPMKLINGDLEFCQTFFDDVKVPKNNLVGKLNEGWSVAKALLKYERNMMSIMSSIVEKEEGDIVAIAKHYVGLDGSGKLANNSLRSQLTEHLMRAQGDALNALRLYQQHKGGVVDRGLGLTMKYLSTSEQQHKDELLLAIMGNRGLSWHDQTFSKSEKKTVKNWAYNKAHTIAGGTSEIQLNIIAKKALQLPS